MPEPASAPELNAAEISALTCGPGRTWTRVEVVARTGSTNADLLARARLGTAEGLVLAAEEQQRGRGRLGRTWQSLPGGALTFSMLLRPDRVPGTALGWLPLLAGVAVAEAVREVTGIEARLKWPNDVLIGTGKLAGILAESEAGAVVVGVGLNVSGDASTLGVPTATSLAAHGAVTDRGRLLAAILDQAGAWYRRWSPAGDATACGLRDTYQRLSATIGTPVRAEIPGGQAILGVATGLDEAGRLLIRPDAGADQDLAAGPIPISAGDIWHLR